MAKQWEYETLDFRDMISTEHEVLTEEEIANEKEFAKNPSKKMSKKQRMLNKLGEEGWELVCSGPRCLFFIREKR